MTELIQPAYVADLVESHLDFLPISSTVHANARGLS